MLHVIIYLLLHLRAAHGTKIKWTWGHSSSDAARAPRSQRYWDTHGIQRPDYAKTDAEVAAERGDTSSLGGMHCLLLLALALIGVIGSIFYFRNSQTARGARLGSTEGWSSFPLHVGGSEEDSREKARKARLERFGAEKHE